MDNRILATSGADQCEMSPAGAAILTAVQAGNRLRRLDGNGLER